MEIPTIRTSRLVLRPFTAEDAEAMHLILAGKDVLRYFPRTEAPTLSQVERMVAGIMKHWEQKRYGVWAVTLMDSGTLMGRCGLQFLPDTDEVEVDFLLGRPFWGKGYATEASKASLAYGFEHVDAEIIVGIVHPGNLASQRVLEKLGMERKQRTVYFGMDVYRYAINRP